MKSAIKINLELYLKYKCYLNSVHFSTYGIWLVSLCTIIVIEVMLWINSESWSTWHVLRILCCTLLLSPQLKIKIFSASFLANSIVLSNWDPVPSLSNLSISSLLEWVLVWAKLHYRFSNLVLISYIHLIVSRSVMTFKNGVVEIYFRLWRL